MHFMLQKEVVERWRPGLAAVIGVGCRSWFSTTAAWNTCSTSARARSTRRRRSTRPSCAWCRTPCCRTRPRITLLERVVREAFNQRRKTLRNTLKLLLSNAEIEAAGVDGSLRPEQLDLAAFVRLADKLANKPPPATSPTWERARSCLALPATGLDCALRPFAQGLLHVRSSLPDRRQRRHPLPGRTIATRTQTASPSPTPSPCRTTAGPAKLMSRHWVITDGDGQSKKCAAPAWSASNR
jgi:hypothetical protein